MQTNTQVKRSIDTLVYLYDLHTSLFPNVIEDISDKDAQNRLNTKANHIAWLTGSLVQGRFEIANVLGIDRKQTSDKLFKDYKGIQDGITYPSLAEFKKDWDPISRELRDALSNLESEQLNGPDPFGMPGKDLTLFDVLAFIIDRESYCIGQIGLYRRLLGYEAMKYPE